MHIHSKEFVIHVMHKHDYRMRSDQYLFILLANDHFMFSRDRIFNVIKMAYTSKSKTNLPIYGIRNKDLREFQTKEKDV
jgi:hypothetical protein